MDNSLNYARVIVFLDEIIIIVFIESSNLSLLLHVLVGTNIVTLEWNKEEFILAANNF